MPKKRNATLVHSTSNIKLGKNVQVMEYTNNGLTTKKIEFTHEIKIETDTGTFKKLQKFSSIKEAKKLLKSELGREDTLKALNKLNKLFKL